MTGFLSGVANGQVPPTDGYTIQPIGFGGTNYEYNPASGGFYRRQVARAMNDGGQVIGFNERYIPGGGTRVGNDAWLADASGTRLLGFTGEGYEYTRTVSGKSGVHRDSFPIGLNDAGQVVGTSVRYTTSRTGLGRDVWLFNSADNTIQSIGLTGANYEYTATVNGTPQGPYRGGNALGINASGQVFGSSERYAPSARRLGQDAWVYNGTSTSIIGLVGGTYESDTGQGLYHYNEIQSFNDAGQAGGYHERISNDFTVGRDAWFFDGVTTREIGLYGAAYEHPEHGGTYRYNSVDKIGSSGQVSGYTLRRNGFSSDQGQDAWIFDGTSTKQIGFTGPNYENGVYRFSSAQFINGAGTVVGHSTRAGAASGQDAWRYDGASTQLIGLTGPGYERAASGGGVHRFNSIFKQTDSGFIAGNANRYNAAGTSAGGDCWLSDGTTTHTIALTGGTYEFPTANGGMTHTASFTGLNEAGQAIGYSERFNTASSVSGRGGWFFDASTATLTELDFGNATTGKDNFTTPQFLTDEGVVLGSYRWYEGTKLTDRVFWWSAEAGFYDLGGLTGNLSASDWSRLDDIYYFSVRGAAGTTPGGSPITIIGTGLAAGQSSESDSSQSVFMLTAVPEPTLATIALVTLTCLRRRRR